MLDFFDLSHNNIGDKGAEALAEAFKKNTSITSIYLSDNNIGAEGAKALAEAIKTHPNLTTFGLWGNNIGDEGAEALAEAIKQNPNIDSIDLSNNQIGDEGALALAEAIKTHPSLASIDLRHNNIGDKGAEALAEAFKKNTSITSLNLWRNNIGEEFLKLIQTLCTRNEEIQAIKQEFEVGDWSNDQLIKLSSIKEELKYVREGIVTLDQIKTALVEEEDFLVNKEARENFIMKKLCGELVEEAVAAEVPSQTLVGCCDPTPTNVPPEEEAALLGNAGTLRVESEV